MNRFWMTWNSPHLVRSFDNSLLYIGKISNIIFWNDLNNLDIWAAYDLGIL